MNMMLAKRLLLARSVSLPRVALPLVAVQARWVHARGYNDFQDSWSHIFHEINFALGGSKTTDAFAFVFRKYG